MLKYYPTSASYCFKSVFVLVPQDFQSPAYLLFYLVFSRIIEPAARNFLWKEFQIGEIPFIIVGIFISLMVTELLHKTGRGISQMKRH